MRQRHKGWRRESRLEVAISKTPVTTPGILRDHVAGKAEHGRPNSAAKPRRRTGRGDGDRIFCRPDAAPGHLARLSQPMHELISHGRGRVQVSLKKALTDGERAEQIEDGQQSGESKSESKHRALAS